MFSVLFSGLAGDLTLYKNIPFLGTFSLSFTTFGYIITIMIFFIFLKEKKYLYLNMGVSLLHLYIFGFLFNLIFILSLFTIFEILWMLKNYI